MVELDPWGSATVESYSKLFEEFGIDEFDSSEVPEPMDLMRRGIIFGQRDYDLITDAMKSESDGDYAALSGFMPSGNVHIGNMMVMRELIWHQRQGADTYFLIADLEAHSARGKSWEECREISRDYILSMIALGFEPDNGTIYRQSENRELQDLAFELGEQTNFNELRGIYGFDGDTNIAHMESVLTQAADILYPQIDEPKPTVIPVGADQDPHLRLTRSLAKRMRMFGVTEAYASFEIDEDAKAVVSEALEELGGEATAEEVAEDLRGEGEGDLDDDLLKTLDSGGGEKLRPRTRILSRDAPDDAFDDLVEAIRSEYEDVEVYDEHIDVFGLDDAAEDGIRETVRQTEVDHGGYGFYAPSSIYHRFMTGLTGGKMSSSIPESHIALTDDPEEGADKVMSSKTGGRETAEEQREKGGEADDCPVYELYAYMLAEDDEHAKTVYDECVNGERLCGGCKSEAADLMEEFLEEHHEKREEAKEKVDEFGVEL